MSLKALVYECSQESKLRTCLVFINMRMDKQNVVHSYNDVHFTNKKK